MGLAIFQSLLNDSEVCVLLMLLWPCWAFLWEFCKHSGDSSWDGLVKTNSARRMWLNACQLALALEVGSTSGGKACKLLLPCHLFPSFFSWQILCRPISLLIVSDLLSPVYVRNDLLTLSFPLQQMQWQLLGFLFSRDSCQTSLNNKIFLLTRSRSMRSHLFIHCILVLNLIFSLSLLI